MNPTFHLNFIGLCLQDFPSGVQFYTEQLGIAPAMTHPNSPGWMMLLDGWRSSGPVQEESAGDHFRSQRMARKKSRGNMAMPGGKSRPAKKARSVRQKVTVRGMIVELFTAQLPEGWTGDTFENAGRLSLFASLKDVSRFTDGIMGSIESPESVKWQVWAEDGQSEDWKARGVRLRCADIQPQLDFFHQAFGWRVLSAEETSGKLLQGEGMPTLDLVQDADLSPLELPASANPLRSTPSWLSVETNDIQAAEARFQELGVTLLRPKTAQAWGGTDIVLADVEGNPVQVVQQGTHEKQG